MSLLPDPDALLAVADRIARHATAIRRHADLLARSVGRTTWHGPAARAFAAETLAVCGSLRHSADRLDAAAAALRRHAARVRAVVHDLVRAATDAAALGLDANRVLSDLVLDPRRLAGDGDHLAGSLAVVGSDAVSVGRGAAHAVGDAADAAGGAVGHALHGISLHGISLHGIGLS